MIDILFYYGTEIIFVRVKGEEVGFSTSLQRNLFATIEGLRLNQAGVIKEFPDLEGKDNWKEEAIKRFKKKIKQCKNEDERVDYIISDLKKYGYIPKRKSKSGHRPEKIR